MECINRVNAGDEPLPSLLLGKERGFISLPYPPVATPDVVSVSQDRGGIGWGLTMVTLHKRYGDAFDASLRKNQFIVALGFMPDVFLPVGSGDPTVTVMKCIEYVNAASIGMHSIANSCLN